MCLKKAVVYTGIKPYEIDLKGIQFVHPTAIQSALVVATAMRSSILPAVQDLTIAAFDRASAESCIFLINDGLQRVEIVWDQCDYKFLIPVIQRLGHCPDLTHLSIKLKGETRQPPPLVEVIGYSLSCLDKIRSLHMPTALALHPTIWSAMSTRSTLAEFRCNDWSDRLPVNVFRAASSLTHTEFVFLQRVTLTVTYGELVGMLPPKAILASVVEFHVNVIDAQDADSMGIILCILVPALPNLNRLKAVFYENHFQINRSDILPVMHWEHLEHLEIYNENVSALDDIDYRILVSALPLLRTLIISPDPDSRSEDPLATLLALSYIAQHCPCIESIAIYIQVDLDEAEDVHPFSTSLQSFSLGLYYHYDPEYAASLLVRLLIHARPAFTMLPSPQRPGISEDMLEAYENGVDLWEEVELSVKRIWPSINDVERANKKRIDALEEELARQTDRLKELEALLAAERDC